MKTYLIRYFIIYPHIRKVVNSANSYNECKHNFLKNCGIKTEQIINITIKNN